MKLKKFLLNERRSNNTMVENLDLIKDVLVENCLPALNDLHKSMPYNLPYIGKQKYVDVYEIKTTRKDRIPKDSSSSFHDFFDNVFEEEFGIRGRSECIFVTGNLNEAENYGNVFCVFPVGKYKVLWNPFVADLYSKVEDSPHYPRLKNYILNYSDSLIDDYNDTYREGRNGTWKYGKIELKSFSYINKESFTKFIFEKLELNKKYIEKWYLIDDFYKKYWKNFYANVYKVNQLTIDKNEIISYFNEKGNENNAECFVERDQKGNYKLRLGNGRLLINKNFKSEKEAWELFQKYKCEEAVDEFGMPLHRQILVKFIKEKWAKNLLKYWVNTKNEKFIVDIRENSEWIPEKTYDEFIEEKTAEGKDELNDLISGYKVTPLNEECVNAHKELMMDCDKYILITFGFKEDIYDWIKTGDFKTHKIV